MKQVFDAITRYATAYNEVEKLQGDEPAPLPKGDQKTGVIGEFYGKLFAQHEHPNAKVLYAGHEKGYDLVVQEPERKELRIQVKAVSAYSLTGRISPIRTGWSQLYLIRLDLSFQPVGFWIVPRDSLGSTHFPLLHRTMPVDDRTQSGSAEFSGRTSRLSELRDALRHAGLKRIETSRRP